MPINRSWLLHGVAAQMLLQKSGEAVSHPPLQLKCPAVQHTMRLISGGVVGSSFFIMFIGASGLLSVILHWISPITGMPWTACWHLRKQASMGPYALLQLKHIAYRQASTWQPCSHCGHCDPCCLVACRPLLPPRSFPTQCLRFILLPAAASVVMSHLWCADAPVSRCVVQLRRTLPWWVWPSTLLASHTLGSAPSWDCP